MAAATDDLPSFAVGPTTEGSLKSASLPLSWGQECRLECQTDSSDDGDEDDHEWVDGCAIAACGPSGFIHVGRLL